LKNWLVTGTFEQTPRPLPNIILTPLVVITHLTQYWQYLQQNRQNLPQHDDLHACFTHDAETLGLCTGLLSAAAVSSSQSEAELKHYGAVAVRLGMLIGGVVDAQDISTDLEGESKSFSIVWKSPELGADVDRILKASSGVIGHFHFETPFYSILT
jgi:hypothetical protein